MVICVIFSLAHRTTLESLFLNGSLLFPQKLYFQGMSHMSNHVNYCVRPYVRVREIFIVLTSYYSFSVRHLKRYVNTIISEYFMTSFQIKEQILHLTRKQRVSICVFHVSFVNLVDMRITRASTTVCLTRLVFSTAESQLLNSRMRAYKSNKPQIPKISAKHLHYDKKSVCGKTVHMES